MHSSLDLRACTNIGNNETKRPKRPRQNHRNKRNETTKTKPPKHTKQSECSYRQLRSSTTPRTNHIDLRVCKNINQSEPEGQMTLASALKWDSSPLSPLRHSGSPLRGSLASLSCGEKSRKRDQGTFARVRVVHSLLQIQTLFDSAQQTSRPGYGG